MARQKVTVVISQAAGRNPAKRRLEEDIATALIMNPATDVSLVPHLYDMSQDHTGMLFLRSVPGPLIVLGWLYERAIRWTLDRASVRGKHGVTLLKSADDEANDDLDAETGDESNASQGIGSTNVPDRMLYCIDLRVTEDSETLLSEIQRIVQEIADASPAPSPNLVSVGLSIPDAQPASATGTAQHGTTHNHTLMGTGAATSNNALKHNGTALAEESDAAATQHSPPVDLMDWIKGSPNADQLQRYLQPERMLEARKALDSGAATHADKESLPEDTGRRWYPVIDYSRCTNCMECIDFCLFGVYGVDTLDRILVEEQDNCKKGCPACSRVCPADAIIFPQHKTPAIAGAEGEVGGLKIDLSLLFGGDDGESPLEMAVKERDRELILDGRDAVGATVGIKQRDREEVEQLINDLDALEF